MGGKVRLDDRACPLSTALGYVGEWWTILILHDCFDGYSRFDQFQANIGLSSSMLTSRLKTLVADGILEKRLYQERPPRHEYLLTPRGRSLRPVLVAMAAWTLIPDKFEDGDAPKPRFGAFLTTLVAFFLVEMGDKTQIATVALAARFPDLLSVVAGTTFGMVLANAPVILFGNKLAAKVPLKYVRWSAAACFGGLAVGAVVL